MFDVWKNVLEEIKKDISSEKFNTFLKRTTLISTKDGDIKIGVPNSFMQVNIKKNFDKNIREALTHNNIEVNSTDYIIADTNTKVTRSREITVGDTKRVQKSTRPYLSNNIDKNKNGLVPEYTFDSFVVGTNNDLATLIAKEVVKDPGGKRNPFFVYGKSGVGKTHLVQAVGNEILKNNPNLNIL
jgi:chromosomal replication initiator protein